MIEAATAHSEIEKIIVFGSRAMGNVKSGLGVDIALVGNKVTSQIFSVVCDFLEEETMLPYFFDVVCLAGITNDHLLWHLVEDGKVIYESG